MEEEEEYISAYINILALRLTYWNIKTSVMQTCNKNKLSSKMQIWQDKESLSDTGC